MKRVAGSVGFTVIIASLIVAVAALDTLAKQPNEQKIETLYFNRIAVAPFLVSHRQPRMDASMDDTLSCPLNEICLDDPTIAPEAGATLTRLVLKEIQRRFEKHVIRTGAVDAGYTTIRIEGARDTPRTLARQLGEAITADLMIIGVVWRYRQKELLDGVLKRPASVAFAIYLVNVQTGRRMWRGIYNETQAYMTQNILNISKQLKMGTRWLTAAELAHHGVKEAFRTFPERVKPGEKPR